MSNAQPDHETAARLNALTIEILKRFAEEKFTCQEMIAVCYELIKDACVTMAEAKGIPLDDQMDKILKQAVEHAERERMGKIQ